MARRTPLVCGPVSGPQTNVVACQPAQVAVIPDGAVPAEASSPNVVLPPGATVPLYDALRIVTSRGAVGHATPDRLDPLVAGPPPPDEPTVE